MLLDDENYVARLKKKLAERAIGQGKTEEPPRKKIGPLFKEETQLHVPRMPISSSLVSWLSDARIASIFALIAAIFSASCWAKYLASSLRSFFWKSLNARNVGRAVRPALLAATRATLLARFLIIMLPQFAAQSFTSKSRGPLGFLWVYNVKPTLETQKVPRRILQFGASRTWIYLHLRTYKCNI
jgi:hypothetical protein